jgi:asparagine synthetase B (glutamine-hydrolysing)
MCGIFFSLCGQDHVPPDPATARLLRNRGPDSCEEHRISLSSSGGNGRKLHATFVSTVLSLRGTSVVEQPLVSKNTGHVLCWNGEAWSIAGQRVSGNDSKAVLEALSENQFDELDRKSVALHTARVLSSIRGPYAFVYLCNGYLFYGRDCLGRRSLLRKTTADGQLVLSSVCDNSSGDDWAEVEADGICMVDVDKIFTHSLQTATTHIPHRRAESLTDELSFVGKWPCLRTLLNSPGNSLFNDESINQSG